MPSSRKSLWESIGFFLLAGGVSACANIAIRHGLSRWLPFELAVLFAYLAGMLIAFALMRRFAFETAAHATHVQLSRFVAVNLWGLTQTLVLSSLLLRYALPRGGIVWHPELIAHTAALACQSITSYVGHRYFTFRR